MFHSIGKPFWLFLLLLLIIPYSAHALEVSGIRFGTHPDKQRIVIELSKQAEFRAFTMENPARIVVDLPSFSFNANSVSKPASSMVRDIRNGPISSKTARLVFETAQNVAIQSAFALPKDNSQPNRIVIDFIRLSANLETSSPKFESPKNLNEKNEPAVKRSIEKPLIILDPGHGGKDPGAISVHGVFEKNIVLAVAKELVPLLEADGYKVKMTRTKDVFIPLRDRVRFAKKHDGDLFISLHADSIRSADVTGASVYTLSDKASDKEAEKLAERENKADLIAGVNLSNQEDDVTSILIDLASRETMNQSRFLANTIVKNFKEKDVEVLSRSPHRSAGFAVLKALDIPSVLVEMGYLTNEREAEKLNTPEHRRKIARALKASIDDYFERVASLSGE